MIEQPCKQTTWILRSQLSYSSILSMHFMVESVIKKTLSSASDYVFSLVKLLKSSKKKHEMGIKNFIFAVAVIGE